MKTKLFFALVLGFFLPSAVLACSCLPPQPPLASMQESAAVFAGRVTTISVSSGLAQSGLDPVEVTFDVQRVWKGTDEGKVTLTTARDSAACGFNFEKDKEYLVYAYEGEGQLSTGLCTRTALLADANDDLTELGEPMDIAGRAEPPVQEDDSSMMLFAGLGIAGAVLVVLLLGYFRRK